MSGNDKISVLALMEGPGALAGWGPRKLYHAGLAELEFYHRTSDPAERAAHAEGAQAYAFLALARADPTVQEEPPAPRRAPQPVTFPEVVSFLEGLGDVRGLSAEEDDAVLAVLAVLTRDETAYRS